MRFLLDTCVLSELRRPRPEPAVLSWLDANDDDALFVSVLTIGEIAQGAAQAADRRRRERIGAWLAGLEDQFADRIVAVDHQIARLWGELSGAARRRGRPLAVVDSLLAATAVSHGLTLVTRNTSDFDDTGVMVFNPWPGP